LVVAAPPPATNVHGTRCDVGVGTYDVAKRFLALLHGFEGNVLRGFGCGRDQADVLLREETLWNDDEEVNRQRERREEHHERGPPPAHGDVEAALIGV